MIQEIRIKDLGVISQATLPLGPGFSVVTGETGAGKTMVITALGLLLGRRADAGAVRHGAKQAVADATLVLPASSKVLDRAEEAGALVERYDDEAELIVTRTLSAEGRSRASVGGRAAPVGVLVELGEDLIAIHGQTDQMRLKGAVTQRAALDKFAGAPLGKVLATYKEAFEKWGASSTELAELQAASRERIREAESLQVALEEIDAVDPQPGEDSELKTQSLKLTNVEELRANADAAHEALNSEAFDATSVISLVETAKHALEQVADDDAEIKSLAERLHEIGILAAEVSTDLAAYLADLDAEGPGRLAALEERRGDLNRLIRKYAPDIDEVIAWAEVSRARLTEIQGDDGRIEELRAETEALRTEVETLGEKLSKLRAKAAKDLAARVTAELAALAMPDAKFVLDLEKLTEPTRHGFDAITMLLQPHAGTTPRPLGKGASGGELSRVMLAIEVVLAAVDPVPTFVFDEVDAGVGGKAAVEIGKRLAMLAKHVQVIVVTHLPQVAAYADRHVRVIKSSDAGAAAGAGFTASDVVLLDEAERVRELARMLAGQEDSSTAQAHAEELLGDAQQMVSSLS
ncbi:DNA repair protein RecN [Paeniglutamicibacter gangotriensis]|uniref:DNA repair protein RecN n=1 Tax=Paeniglutamicibacter gangotriensis Lz1y TaxID=1276920 RepID=M7N8R5_9MICC|nr:DNA repair protein RecN [Paeniglutamicibacter gangotriensis]EMQ98169.1 DNA repair and genetic recombination [Paeniglutamicibacter gangotriensis Lz1y]